MRLHPHLIVVVGIQIALGVLTACSPQTITSANAGTAVSTTDLPTSAPATSQPTAAPEPTLAAGDIRISDVDGMKQVYVPAGDFIMGADDEEAKDTPCRVNGVSCAETPVNTVFVPAFWIDKYEVTNYQYSLCVAAGKCLAPRLLAFDCCGNFTGTEYYENPDFANYPVTYVDFFSARDYCTWAGRRLPNEREWEKAARGTDGRKYTWGNDPIANDKGNFCDANCTKTQSNQNYDDGYAQTAPVGSFPNGTSPYGAMDMAGNVWEWVDTIPKPYPYVADDGREDPDTRTASCYSATDCPLNTARFGDGPERIWRGGTWANGLWWMRATVRYHSVPEYYHNSLGFRCAADAEPAQ